jgi:hypothetical protein
MSKRERPRSHPKTAERQPQQVEASLVPQSGMSVHASIISPPLDARRRPRDGGQIWWTQKAIDAHYCGDLPRGSVNILQLTEKVQKILSDDREYKKTGYKPPKRDTVTRALAMLRGERRAPPKPVAAPPTTIFAGPLIRRPGRRRLTAEEVKAAADRAERKPPPGRR